MSKEQNYIDVLIKRVQWIEEDITSSAAYTAAVILELAPRLRETDPVALVKLLESYSYAFTPDIDKWIAENEEEIAQEEAEYELERD